MRKHVRSKVVFIWFIVALIFLHFTMVLNETAAKNKQRDELFISEYIEGSSFNKAIEIYNGTGASVNLDKYQLALYSNGKPEPSQSERLSGILHDGEVLVISHSQASNAIQQVADITSNIVNFNGNDAIVLEKDGQVMDAVGTIGDDSDFTKDITLVRNANIMVPSQNFEITEWTTYGKDTFIYLGSHTIGGEEPTDPEPNPKLESYSIGEARQLSDGKEVVVEGIVTVNSEAISNGNQFSTYIQDETGGMNLFLFAQGEIPELEKGDYVKVTGKLASYKGLKKMVPTSIDILAKDKSMPEVQQITLKDLQNKEIAESYEGELIRVNGFIASIPDSPVGGGYNIPFMDKDYHSTLLRIMENSLTITRVKEKQWYDVTAIVSQYDDYQLIPTEQEDIQVAEEQPEPPSAAGEYKTTVNKITDGDTIRISDPVLGSDRVRFVNMDTPETYPAKNKDLNREEINGNQKLHGDAATDHIQTLIQPGDEVIIKVGDQPMDDYGRLLAEVITTDGKNVNLEMVRDGYAVSYFIAPIDEEAYPKYQQAVKEAKDKGLGIWNADNLLMELPFAFRANDDQKGFLRYVGNSDTKEYVIPDNWAEVPVEKRVFFSSPKEAESYGYTPVCVQDE
ncbi:thermonuclease family protein [Virgibacillus proomii]|jgi:2',3'-cyclic-nucleotide 2'-phosphodiesterase / 3'-nucleotidase / 5'-nucleotidase|uniref:thermonuclease family protein n=1 Tax=Virgibacillus proomii TaxID=84407 RepID=UPI000987447C|nr:thermonuclease family protein [Virgibacillus proomii]